MIRDGEKLAMTHTLVLDVTQTRPVITILALVTTKTKHPPLFLLKPQPYHLREKAPSKFVIFPLTVAVAKSAELRMLQEENIVYYPIVYLMERHA